MTFSKISNDNIEFIIKIKWIDFAYDHLAILTNKNHFQIYDMNENIQDPEFEFIFEKNEKINDFTWSKTKYMFDMSVFSFFFVNSLGEILCLGPILMKNLVVKKDAFDFLEERVLYDQCLQNEITSEILKFIHFIKENSVFLNNNYVFSLLESNQIKFWNHQNVKFILNFFGIILNKETKKYFFEMMTTKRLTKSILFSSYKIHCIIFLLFLMFLGE